MRITTKRIAFASLACILVLMMQSFSYQKPDDDKEEKPTNLKILPKNISEEELHQVMRGYSKSLGVRCNFCHVSTGEGKEAVYDFASDSKHTKIVARDMMRMTASINKKYISKIDGGKLERISCVTCHMGKTVPTISTDSLPKKEKPVMSTDSLQRK
ncbi:MAG: c-type cytochrome [Bacteroidota bacterium]